MLGNLELVTIVKVLGSLACGLGLLACFRLLRFKPADFAANRAIQLGFVTLSTVAFYKLIAFAAFLAVPAAGLTLANYHLMEGTHETMSCMQCHVMWPMGNDLHSPDSQTLAARHMRNKWIPERQCFQCHVDYALAGSIESKMDGYRHLSRYTSRTYTEPIQYRGKFNNHNCLHCHEGAKKFEAVKSHHTVRELLDDSAVSCLNCHGRAHPSREQRTPGHPDYEKLMEAIRK